MRSRAVHSDNDKALFDLGNYTFEGIEYRLLYSWPMLYAKCGPDEGEILSDLAEHAALYANLAGGSAERPPLGEAYVRAVAQGYIIEQPNNKSHGQR
jgi:hypothetical protein